MKRMHRNVNKLSLHHRMLKRKIRHHELPKSEMFQNKFIIWINFLTLSTMAHIITTFHWGGACSTPVWSASDMRQIKWEWGRFFSKHFDYPLLVIIPPITVAVWSKAWNVFGRSNTGYVGSNLTWSMDVCVPLFCVCALLCAGSDLRRADPPSKESYRLCIKIKNWKATKVQQFILFIYFNCILIVF
jgi:hypothetical protein